MVRTCKPSPEEADERQCQVSGHIDPVPKKAKICICIRLYVDFSSVLLHVCCLSVAVIGYSDKNNLKKKGFILVYASKGDFGLQSSPSWSEAWHQEPETVPGVGKQDVPMLYPHKHRGKTGSGAGYKTSKLTYFLL